MHFGDYDTTETVVIPFNTFSSDDPSASVTVTNLANTDVHIHKDGGTTQRSSASGVTVSIDFDSITGNHIVSIDLSDNTDAGFYAAGSRYQVRLEGITVDGATLNVWIGTFSIGCTLRPTTDGRTLDVTATGAAGIDWGNIENKTTANDLSGTDIQLCDTVTTNTDMVGTDNAALASVCTEARLAELDAANLPTDIATAQSDLDTLTGADGATLATVQGNYAPAKAGNAMDLVANAVDATSIANDAITAAKLAADCITNAKIADDAIAAENIATNALAADGFAADFVDEILDEEVDNDGTAISLRGFCKLALGVLTGKSSGGGTSTIVFRDINDSKNRISATVDANGNRTAVGTRDAS